MNAIDFRNCGELAGSKTVITSKAKKRLMEAINRDNMYEIAFAIISAAVSVKFEEDVCIAINMLSEADEVQIRSFAHGFLSEVTVTNNLLHLQRAESDKLLIAKMANCKGDLKALRKLAGLTQKELAEKSEVSLRTISDIETGVTSLEHCRPQTLQKIAAALNIETEMLK